MVTADNSAKTRSVTCENCPGSGLVRPSGILARLVGFSTALCKVCDGVGRVEKPVSDSIANPSQ